MSVASGNLAVRALAQAGVKHLFTLSGAHIFPLYEGARDAGVRLVDTRHEQAAVFGAEGLAKLTRRPQVVGLTAGPGVTNGMSGIAGAYVGGSPLLVVGGRAPQATWGRGALQELDHVALMAPITKHAATATAPERVAGDVLQAYRVAGSGHRGPTFVDVPIDVVFDHVNEADLPAWEEPTPIGVNDDDVVEVAALLARAQRPIVLAGTDCWFAGAEHELRTLVETVGCPVVMNGMGRGLVPADHPHALSRARGAALGQADLVLVVGTALDFRVGYGAFGEAQVVHVADSPEQVATHADLAASIGGDLRQALSLLAEQTAGPTGETAASRRAFLAELQATETGKRAEETELRTSDVAPLHPARVYGALSEVLDRDAVVIGDGGDFVSFAGRYVDSYTPGCWLDPGPYGCLGTGMGYAAAARLARPSSQVVTLLGDGAAGFGLMDVDTLVRHELPVVMVVGNNGIWALEKYPMQMLYDGWDTITDLRPGTRYDEVVTALGGGGETVTEAAELVPALERAFASGVPYLVNVLTDPEAKYPRKTMGI